MSVRAKFKLDSFESSLQVVGYDKKADGTDDYSKPIVKEMRTLKMTPVYSNDPQSENRRFWNASPSGSLNLGVINQDAWKHFELGEEYYLDFTPAR